MRIISPKMHDYYDTALGQGADPTLVFVRKQEPGSLIWLPFSDLAPVEYATETYKVNSSTTLTLNPSRCCVIFCGKLYRRAVVEAILIGPNEEQQRRFWFHGNGVAKTCAHMFEALVHDAEFDHKHAPTFINGDRRRRRYITSLRNKDSFYRWKRERSHKDKVEVDPTSTYDWLPLHRKEGTPIFGLAVPTNEEYRSMGARQGYYHGEHVPTLYRVEKNPSLAAVGFQQVFPPFQAYQEIDMYLGGVMGGDGRPMVQLTDKEVLVKHGFDSKTSFRKPKESAK